MQINMGEELKTMLPTMALKKMKNVFGWLLMFNGRLDSKGHSCILWLGVNGSLFEGNLKCPVPLYPYAALRLPYPYRWGLFASQRRSAEILQQRV